VWQQDVVTKDKLRIAYLVRKTKGASWIKELIKTGLFLYQDDQGVNDKMS
jgi:hypothetical protein